jgi:hypothetical protein
VEELKMNNEIKHRSFSFGITEERSSEGEWGLMNSDKNVQASVATTAEQN